MVYTYEISLRYSAVLDLFGKGSFSTCTIVGRARTMDSHSLVPRPYPVVGSGNETRTHVAHPQPRRMRATKIAHGSSQTFRFCMRALTILKLRIQFAWPKISDTLYVIGLRLDPLGPL